MSSARYTLDGRIRAIVATTQGARVPSTQQQRGIIYRGRPAPHLPLPIVASGTSAHGLGLLLRDGQSHLLLRDNTSLLLLGH